MGLLIVSQAHHTPLRRRMRNAVPHVRCWASGMCGAAAGTPLRASLPVATGDTEGAERGRSVNGPAESGSNAGRAGHTGMAVVLMLVTLERAWPIVGGRGRESA